MRKKGEEMQKPLPKSLFDVKSPLGQGPGQDQGQGRCEKEKLKLVKRDHELQKRVKGARQFQTH